MSLHTCMFNYAVLELYCNTILKNHIVLMFLVPLTTNLRHCAPKYINYRLKSKAAITFHCQLRSTSYHPVQIEKYLKSNCAIEVASMKYMEIFLLWRGSHHVQPPNHHFSLSAKMNGTQRRALVSLWRMYCTYCGMAKGTSWVEQWKKSSM